MENIQTEEDILKYEHVTDDSESNATIEIDNKPHNLNIAEVKEEMEYFEIIDGVENITVMDYDTTLSTEIYNDNGNPSNTNNNYNGTPMCDQTEYSIESNNTVKTELVPINFPAKQYQLCFVKNEKIFIPEGNINSNQVLNCTDPKIKQYKCNDCKKEFTTKYYLSQHIKFIHLGIKQHTCNVCKKEFTQKIQLTHHMVTHLGTKPHKCNLCNMEFTQKGNLKKHMTIHTGTKQHKCNICNKEFPWKSRLEKHILIHSGIKPYKCDLCKKEFRQKSNLIVHMGKHSGIEHKCKISKNKFTQKGNLTQHMVIHSARKQHKCNMCTKEFTRKIDLEKHILIHSGIKHYTCYACKKQFIQKSHLIQHMGIHSEEKPYKCKRCKKEFTQKGNLTQHMVTHSGKNSMNVVCVIKKLYGRLRDEMDERGTGQGEWETDGKYLCKHIF